MFYDFLGYIDPGTGSLIVQAIIAAIIGASVTVKLYWHWLLKILGIKKSTKEDNKED